MILTCPDCATSYYVPDAAVGQGRKVRCATCGFAWRARPEDDEDQPFFGAEGSIDNPEPAARPAAEAAADDELDAADGEASDAEGLEAEPATDEPPVFAPPPRTPAKARGGLSPVAIQALAWGGAAAALLVIFAAAVLFRVQVVRVWPASAGAFARIGLPVNAAGVMPQEVRVRRMVEAGRPALVVSGVLTNVRGQPVSPPPLSITLVDRQGRVLSSVTSAQASGVLAPGAARSFSVTLADPPAAASEVDVDFVLGGRGAAAAR